MCWGGSSILVGTKTSEGKREGHLERRACGNDPGIPCEASWPPQGRTLGGHHSHLEQEGSQVLSDCAKCLLCPFRLSLSDQLVAPRSGNHVKALTYHITSRVLSPQWEFVSAFRQAQCQQNALADVTAGMRVLFQEGTDTIEDLSLAYGGVGDATISAQKSCQQLLGR